MSKSEHFTYKLIVLGQSSIGKTCLTLRYTDDCYSQTVKCTVGVDFKSRTIDVDEIKVRLNIFDTAGQETYKSIVRTYFSGVDAALFCYAIDNHSSFEDLTGWLKEFYNSSDSPSCLKVLVGTKSDVPASSRQVTEQQAKIFMQREAFLFHFETSAKQNSHVNEVFEQIARNLLVKSFKSKKYQQEKQSNKRELTQMLNQTEGEKPSGCC